jgi:hypothetical protein
MLVSNVLVKLDEEVVKCEKLENSFKENGFVVPSEFTERKAELQFAVNYILNNIEIEESLFTDLWKFAKRDLTRCKAEQDAFIRHKGYGSAQKDLQIKDHEHALKVLETTFPDEAKAVEVPPTAAVTITAEAVATWLQSKPTDAEITNVLSTIRGSASDLYKEFIELDIKHAHRELIEGIQALLNKQ